MPDGTYVLMRPIARGFYKMSDLIDGSVDMEMVARCNDTIDLEAENERRMFDYHKRKTS